MRKIPEDMMVGTVHSSNEYGDFSIKEYINSHNIIVEFTDTGFVSKAQSGQIRRGALKDNLKPSVFSVGLIGDGHYKVYENGKEVEAYSRWVGMLRRCYCEKLKEKYPTYRDCSVCIEWLNFQNFAEWYYKNRPEGDEKYDLDKDLKIKGNKLYSPETCQIVSSFLNQQDAKAKNYRFFNPEGVLVEVYNLMEFCRDNDLTNHRMYDVANGKQIKHKGWTKAD